jgi:hypothetical protein
MQRVLGAGTISNTKSKEGRRPADTSELDREDDSSDDEFFVAEDGFITEKDEPENGIDGPDTLV